MTRLTPRKPAVGRLRLLLHNILICSFPYDDCQDQTMLTKRTPRACERCRRTRRRCQPPHPCPACVAAGVRCEVRIKARPKRGRLRIPDVSDIGDNDNEVLETAALSDSTTPPVQLPSDLFPDVLTRKPVDTFEQVHELVRTLLRDRCGM